MICVVNEGRYQGRGSDWIADEEAFDCMSLARLKEFVVAVQSERQRVLTYLLLLLLILLSIPEAISSMESGALFEHTFGVTHAMPSSICDGSFPNSSVWERTRPVESVWLADLAAKLCM